MIWFLCCFSCFYVVLLFDIFHLLENTLERSNNSYFTVLKECNKMETNLNIE